MNALMTLLSSEPARHLAMALLHTLWQGFIVAALLYAYLRSAPAEAADRRYGAGLLALFAIVLGALLTLSILNYEPAVAPPGDAKPTMFDRSAADTVDRSGRRAGKGGESPAPAPGGDWYTWATGAWVIGVTVMILRALAVVLGAAANRWRTKACWPLSSNCAGRCTSRDRFAS